MFAPRGASCLRLFRDQLREAAADLPERPGFWDAVESVRRTFGGADPFPCRVLAGLPCPLGPLTPQFDAERLALCVVNDCIHRFSDQAGNELMIVQKFEAEGWPRGISPPAGTIVPRRAMAIGSSRPFYG